MTDTRTAPADLQPVIKTVTVPLAPDQAFRLFTEGIGSWWPLAEFSVEDGNAIEVHFQGHVGGRIYEVARGGAEHLWGTVLEWGPPGRIVISWHPGAEPTTARKVEVTFESSSDGTRVRLTHTGWEGGAKGLEHRAAYETGWDPVLARFVAAATGSPARTSR